MSVLAKSLCMDYNSSYGSIKKLPKINRKKTNKNFLFKYFDHIDGHKFGMSLSDKYEGGNFSTKTYFYNKTGMVPNHDAVFVRRTFDERFIKFLKNNKFNLILLDANDDYEAVECKFEHITNLGERIILCFGQIIPNFNIRTLHIFHNISEFSHYNKFIKSISKLVVPDKPDDTYIYLLNTDTMGFTTIPMKLKNPNLDVEKNYGKKFLPIYTKIENNLRNDITINGKLIILSGVAGSGKSYLIKHLVSVIDRRVIFIPPNLMHSICNPSFTKFLIQNSNTILVLEDAESILSDRANNPHTADAVSNLLNLTDGTYGDLLNITIIATFNMDYEKVDKALRRKGRLQAEYRFNELSVDESNILLTHLDKDYVTDVPMVLTDIYNYDYEQPLNENNKKEIGFN